MPLISEEEQPKLDKMLRELKKVYTQDLRRVLRVPAERWTRCACLDSEGKSCLYGHLLDARPGMLLAEERIKLPTEIGLDQYSYRAIAWSWDDLTRYENLKPMVNLVKRHIRKILKERDASA